MLAEQLRVLETLSNPDSLQTQLSRLWEERNVQQACLRLEALAHFECSSVQNRLASPQILGGGFFLGSFILSESFSRYEFEVLLKALEVAGQANQQLDTEQVRNLFSQHSQATSQVFDTDLSDSQFILTHPNYSTQGELNGLEVELRGLKVCPETAEFFARAKAKLEMNLPYQLMNELGRLISEQDFLNTDGTKKIPLHQVPLPFSKTTFRELEIFFQLMDVPRSPGLPFSFAELEQAWLGCVNNDQESKCQITYPTQIPGVTLCIVIEENPTTNQKSFSPELVIDTQQMKKGKSEAPFIQSTTATQILLHFDLVGLQPNLSFQDAFMENSKNRGFSARYGNGYADLCRSLFAYLDGDQEFLADHFFGEGVDEVRRKLGLVQMSTLNEPAKLVFELLTDIFSEKKPQGDYFSFRSPRNRSDGSCKDAESYYALSVSQSPWTLRRDGDFVYKRGNGAETCIARRDLVIEGVRVRKGFLCRAEREPFTNELRVEPLRPTMFCFSEQESADAFGDQWLATKKAQPKVAQIVISPNELFRDGLTNT